MRDLSLIVVNCVCCWDGSLSDLQSTAFRVLLEMTVVRTMNETSKLVLQRCTAINMGSVRDKDLGGAFLFVLRAVGGR